MLPLAAAAIAPDAILLRELLAVSLTGVIFYTPIYDPDGSGKLVDFTFEYLNPAAQRMMAMPEVPTVTHKQQWPHSQDHGTFQFQVEAFETGEPREYSVSYQADGYDNYYRLAARRAGTGLLVSFTDTAEQPRSPVEEALRAAQAREQQARAAAEAQRANLVHTFEQAPVAIGILRGPTHLIEFANAKMGLIWDRQVAALLGQPHFIALPDLAGQGFEQAFDEVYRTGKIRQFKEVRVAIRQQTQAYEGYFNITYQATYEAPGQISGIIASAVDVTEQVLARQQVEQLNQELEVRVAKRTAALKTALHLTEQQREQLRGQQKHLLRLFEQAPVAIYVLHGLTYVMEVVNPAMSELIGPPLAELLGKPYFEAVPELADQGYPALLAEVWRTGQPFVAREQPAKLRRHGPGETGYFTFVYQPLHDAQGQMTDIMCVAVDVTDQVIARQQVQSLNEELTAKNHALNESNAQLTRTNVDLDTFVYTASHDLKAPITNIESIVLALRDTLPAEVQADALVGHLLDLLDTTVVRFQVTIGQLTDISRLQLAHAGLAEPVVLAQVVQDVRLDLMPALAAAHTQLTVEIDSELVVSFSPANLRSIVYNLLGNAVKYRATDRSSQVQLRAEQTPQAVVLTVQDNGLGMSEVQQRQLFGLFQRLHTHVEGTGVGLYITKRLVENAGGTIHVHSQPNVGSTFTVTFPI
jgi:PAS domain S-box-containing protein